MDPNACLAIILDFTPAKRRAALDACENLRAWLERGGFAPRFSSDMAPQTKFGVCRYLRLGPCYAIMTKSADSDCDGWIFLNYDRAGNVIREWGLAK